MTARVAVKAPRFDLLIKGGEVIDPAAGHAGRLDVAVIDDRIAAVEHDIPAEAASRVIEATGQIVTPGLVDLHTHVYRGATYWGIDADALAWRTGVTTWVDAGSAGAFTLPGFREWIVEPARVRIHALLNVSAIGLVAPDRELAHLEHCDVELFARMAELNRDIVVGVKARIGTPTVGDNGLEPLRRARAAADRSDLPLMAHLGLAPPAIEDVIALMQPGDILTHCFTGTTMRVVDQEGRLLPCVASARRSGVIMDLGHGTGSFAYSTAEPLLAQGHEPDVISTDVHQLSMNGPMFDLPTCMSKLMGMGMSLAEVIRAASSRPAEVLNLERLGSLRPGWYADIALFVLDPGPFRVFDAALEAREIPQLLRNTLTIVGGHPLPNASPEPAAPWVPLTEAQQRWRAMLARDEGEQPAAHLTQADDFEWWSQATAPQHETRG